VNRTRSFRGVVLKISRFQPRTATIFTAQKDSVQATEKSLQLLGEMTCCRYRSGLDFESFPSSMEFWRDSTSRKFMGNQIGPLQLEFPPNRTSWIRGLIVDAVFRPMDAQDVWIVHVIARETRIP